MKKVKKLLIPILLPIWKAATDIVYDRKARQYLKKLVNRKKEPGKPIKTGFIVFEPESWDKLQPVYEMMRADKRFAPEIIVIPSYNNNFSVCSEYGYELHYFQSKYKNVIKAYQNGELINLEEMAYDYIFYQDPYSHHYPKAFQSSQVARHTKVCYVPYGYTTLKNFGDLVKENTSFFRNVYAYFPDTRSNGEIIERRYSRNIRDGLQNVIYLGYPSLKKYMDMDANASVLNITWAPRWSYDAKVGGSHFLEYKDLFLNLDQEYKRLIRPHPMLFTNLIKTNLMTQQQVDSYIRETKGKGVAIDERGPIDEVIRETGVLIADISSVIPAFFLTGKPIIYCDSHLKPNAEFKEMLEGIYIAQTWDEVERYLSELRKGNDYLQSRRKEIISRYRKEHENAATRILDWLAGCNDKVKE